MLNMVQNIKFKSNKNPFQTKLSNDKKSIQKSKNIYVPADKTTNFYEVKPEAYNDLLSKNIQKNYKKTSSKTEKQNTAADKKIAATLKLDDRIEIAAKKESFINLKDHKPNFQNNPTCRLINPSIYISIYITRYNGFV